LIATTIESQFPNLVLRRSMDMTSSAEQQGENRTRAPDASEFDALMQANIVRVFNERDADRRRIALSELYSEGATLYDPETVATGWDAISRAVEDLLLRLPPDFVFSATGHAVGHNGAARLFWRVGPSDGPVAVTGIDVAHIENGRIKLLYVFVDPGAH
jgi:SnoaL-like domain